MKTVSTLRHAVVAMGSVFLAVAGVLCARIVLSNRDAVTIETRNELLQKQIRATEGEVDRAKKLGSSTVPKDLSAVAKLQSKVEQLAAEKHCTVVEFRASSEVSQYLTRFAKSTPITGWGQVSAQFSVAGSPKDVTATLKGLLDSDIPIEFDSMDITREKTNAVGDATVIGHATLRVLIRTAKEAA